MLNQKDISYILEIVSQNLPQILDTVGFDPTVKEPGHSFGERIEEELVKVLVNSNPEIFSPPKVKKGGGKQTRKMEDFLYKNDYINLINIKTGYKWDIEKRQKKNGQPNMCSFKRLVNGICDSELDSYWILSIDTHCNKVSLFNLYDQLVFTNTNIGTGQTMLCEKKFYDYFEQEVDYTKSRKDVILTLKEIDEFATKAHIQLKQKQHQERIKKYERELSKLQ